MRADPAHRLGRSSPWFLAAILGLVAPGCEGEMPLVSDAGPGAADLEGGDIIVTAEDDGSAGDAGDGGLVSDASISDGRAPAGDARPPADAGPSPDAIPAYSGCVKGTFNPYWGDVHAHSTYSDDAKNTHNNKKTPADAFKYARYTSKMNLFIVTDHRPYLSQTEWNNCLSQAKAATKVGAFVAECGMEITHTKCTGSNKTVCLQDHGNVLFPNGTLASWPSFVSPTEFYKRIAQCSTCVGQFNHATYDEWNGFAYSSTGAPKMRLAEMQSGGLKTLFAALNRGWLVSPTLNEDNHVGDYGATGRRSGFYMSALNRDALRESMLARRTFATTDPNASVRLMLGSCWMGSILSGAGTATRKLPFYVEAKDKDAADKFDRVELYGPDASSASQSKLLGKVVCNGKQTCTGTIWLSITPPTVLVARAVQRSEPIPGGATHTDTLISGPLWIRK